MIKQTAFRIQIVFDIQTQIAHVGAINEAHAVAAVQARYDGIRNALALSVDVLDDGHPSTRKADMVSDPSDPYERACLAGFHIVTGHAPDGAYSLRRFGSNEAHGTFDSENEAATAAEESKAADQSKGVGQD